VSPRVKAPESSEKQYPTLLQNLHCAAHGIGQRTVWTVGVKQTARGPEDQGPISPLYQG